MPSSKESPEVKHLIRAGVPNELRGKIWRMAIDMRVRKLRAHLGEGYYERLLKARAGLKSAATNQIELDLRRE